MDTKTLVVGQDVYVRSYTQYFEAKVVKVTSSGVEVQTDCGTLLRFDNEGKECDGNGTHPLSAAQLGTRGHWWLDRKFICSAGTTVVMASWLRLRRQAWRCKIV
jgi:hypothetical protein